MDAAEIEIRKSELGFAKEIIEEYSEAFEDIEFELGILHALNQVCDEMKEHSTEVSIRNYIRSHCDFIFEIGREQIANQNIINNDLRRWAEPICERIFDRYETDIEEVKREFSRFLFLNPALISKLIGSEIIEEDYFESLI